MSRLSARLARLAVVLIGLILIGLAVLHLPPVRARVLDRVRGYAQREFGIALQASSLGYNLLTRSIELRDLSLAATSNGQPFLQADRAVVVLDPAIYLGRFDVSRIAITRPRLTLVRNADGSVNLPPSRPSESASTPLQFGVVSVTGLSATLDDRGAGRSFAVGPFDLSMDTRDSTGRPGAFGPGGFRLRTGQIDLSGTIAGRLAFDGTRLRIEELIADTKPGRLVLNGWADVIGERPALSAKANVTVDLAEATRLARVDARGLGGRLDSVIDVSGGLTAPVMALTMTSRDALYPRLGAVRLNGRGSFSGTRGRSRPSTSTRPPARSTPKARLNWAKRRRLPLGRQAIWPCAGRIFASMISPALRGVRWRFRPVRWLVGLRPSISMLATATFRAFAPRQRRPSNPSLTSRTQ